MIGVVARTSICQTESNPYVFPRILRRTTTSRTITITKTKTTVNIYDEIYNGKAVAPVLAPIHVYGNRALWEYKQGKVWTEII